MRAMSKYHNAVIIASGAANQTPRATGQPAGEIVATMREWVEWRIRECCGHVPVSPAGQARGNRARSWPGRATCWPT